MQRQLEHYVKALIPDQYVILGCTLKSFSLGHIFLMKRFDCKFASDDPNELGGVDDLLLAVAICSRSYEEFLEFISDPKEFKEWNHKWGLEIQKEIKRKKFNLFMEFIHFKNYMKSGIEMPKYWEGSPSQDDEKQTGSHWTQTVVNVLVSDLGYSQSEALNVPVAKALADYFKLLERNGVITLMTDDEMEQIEQSEKEVLNGK